MGVISDEPPVSLRVTPRRRENGVGSPADADVNLGFVSLLMSLVPGPDLEGSRTVASSTPVRLSVPLTEAPRRPAPCSVMDWRTSELRSKRRPVPEEIPDADHELVMERVCAVDVAKASGVVCVRTPRDRRRGSTG